MCKPDLSKEYVANGLIMNWLCDYFYFLVNELKVLISNIIKC
jgi:hypothetical protein